MTTMSVTEAARHLPSVAKRANKNPVIVERYGEPICVLMSLENDDVLDFVRESNPDFRREIEGRWEDRKVDAVGIDELRYDRKEKDRKLVKWADYVDEPEGCKSNFWLNAITLTDSKVRNEFLEASNGAGIMTRPIWKLTSELEMYSDCQCSSLGNSQWLEKR